MFTSSHDILSLDGQHLITQVVPRALLEFSRSIMRERFSAVIRKPVYTFEFDRVCVKCHVMSCDGYVV